MGKLVALLKSLSIFPRSFSSETELCKTWLRSRGLNVRLREGMRKNRKQQYEEINSG